MASCTWGAEGKIFSEPRLRDFSSPRGMRQQKVSHEAFKAFALFRFGHCKNFVAVKQFVNRHWQRLRKFLWHFITANQTEKAPTKVEAFLISYGTSGVTRTRDPRLRSSVGADFFAYHAFQESFYINTPKISFVTFFLAKTVIFSVVNPQKNPLRF